MSQTEDNPQRQLRTDGTGRILGGAATVGGRGPGMKKWLPSKNKLSPNEESRRSTFKRKTNRPNFAVTGSSLVQSKPTK
jgi:hypothetical protein